MILQKCKENLKNEEKRAKTYFRKILKTIINKREKKQLILFEKASILILRDTYLYNKLVEIEKDV